MAKTSDGKDGGLLVGKSHKQGGIQAIVTDDNRPVELEGEEVILTKKAMNDSGVYTISGTPKEIASYINHQIGDGVAFADSPDSAKKMFKKGGEISKARYIPVSNVLRVHTKDGRIFEHSLWGYGGESSVPFLSGLYVSKKKVKSGFDDNQFALFDRGGTMPADVKYIKRSNIEKVEIGEDFDSIEETISGDKLYNGIWFDDYKIQDKVRKAKKEGILKEDGGKVEKIYDTKVIAKLVREFVKKEFPKSKFSITQERGRVMYINLVKAPFDPISVKGHEKFGKDGRLQVSTHPIEDVNLTAEGQKMFQAIKDFTDKYNWDNSDSMTDYFDVNFYLHLNVGLWDKPFEQTAGKKNQPLPHQGDKKFMVYFRVKDYQGRHIEDSQVLVSDVADVESAEKKAEILISKEPSYPIDGRLEVIKIVPLNDKAKAELEEKYPKASEEIKKSESKSDDLKKALREYAEEDTQLAMDNGMMAITGTQLGVIILKLNEDKTFSASSGNGEKIINSFDRPTMIEWLMDKYTVVEEKETEVIETPVIEIPPVEPTKPKPSKEPELKYKSIPASVKYFMPFAQQKTVRANIHAFQDVLEHLEKMVNALPALYATDGQKDKTAYLHYFYGGTDIYIFERDVSAEQYQAFGWTILNGDYQNAEFGYIGIQQELLPSDKIELDFHFEPTKLSVIKAKYEPTPTTTPSPPPEPKKPRKNEGIRKAMPIHLYGKKEDWDDDKAFNVKMSEVEETDLPDGKKAYWYKNKRIVFNPDSDSSPPKKQEPKKAVMKVVKTYKYKPSKKASLRSFFEKSKPKKQ